MHVLQVQTCPSAVLGADVPLAVLAPADYAASGRRYAVLTLLHGITDTFLCWLDHTTLRRAIADLGLIVVMPNCGRSFYINTAAGLRYEDFLAGELQEYIDARYPTLDARMARAVGGRSMGGYGALMLALRHRERWGAAFSHSGALAAPRWLEDPADQAVFGPPGGALRREHDLWALTERPGEPPRLHFDCGIDDFLLEENRAFRRHLLERGIEHIYRERAGGHGWRYCGENLPESIAWLGRTLIDCAPSSEATL